MTNCILVLHGGIGQTVLKAALSGGDNVAADKCVAAEVEVGLDAVFHAGIVGDAKGVAPNRLSCKICKGKTLFSLQGGVVVPGVGQRGGKLEVQRLQRGGVYLPAFLLQIGRHRCGISQCNGAFLVRKTAGQQESRGGDNDDNSQNSDTSALGYMKNHHIDHLIIMYFPGGENMLL